MLVSHHNNMKWESKIENGHYSTQPMKSKEEIQSQKPERDSHNETKLETTGSLLQKTNSRTDNNGNSENLSNINTITVPASTISASLMAHSAYPPVQYQYPFPIAPVISATMGHHAPAPPAPPAWTMSGPESSVTSASNSLLGLYNYSGNSTSNSPSSSYNSNGPKDGKKSDKTDRRKQSTSKPSSNNSSDSDSSKKSPKQPYQKHPAKRSRMGCITCRQRKKRCCETRPKCTECSRLRLNCVWPVPGTEHKNKSKELKEEENVIHHEIYGKIKVLRGIVEYKSDEDPRFQN